LAHLLDAHQIPVVAIAIHAYRDVEIDLIVDRVGLFLPQVPFDPEPRSIGPVKPSASARSGDTAPMLTVLCFQMRLSVSSVSYSSTYFGSGG